MNPKQLPKRKGPEFYIRADLILFLQSRGWYVEIMHGSLYQSGIPDLFCTHKIHGQRWIEVKLPGMQGSMFTKQQEDKFPKLSNNGAGVWILTAATDVEYKKLFLSDSNGKLVDNWMEYFLIKMART